MEPEPADGVVVEDVDDVGDQDQDHSGAESFPGRNIKTRKKNKRYVFVHISDLRNTYLLYVFYFDKHMFIYICR